RLDLAARRVVRLPAVLPGPLEVAAVLEVLRELAGDLACTPPVRALEPVGDPEGQPDLVSDRDARVEHLAVERVDERVPPGDAAAGPLGARFGAEDLPTARERRATPLRLVHVDAVGGGERSRELGSRHARDGQDGAVGWCELVDLLVDELPEAVRN